MLAVHAAARTRVCRRRAKEICMSSQRLLIRNGFVVSMDPQVGDIPNGDVFVDDGKIVEVGRGLDITDAEIVDATGMIVMPGFVDTHRHTWQTPVRGVLPSCTLDHYFAVMLGSVGGHYRPEDVQVGNYAGSLEALNAGVTTLLDWSHINNTPDHSDAAIQGLKNAGIRAVYAHGVPTGGEWWAFSELEHPEDIRRIRETYFSSDDGLITLALAARAPYVELLMGHGPPPTGRLLERGVRPSLSVDVVSSVPGEMFTQMRTALVAERIRSHTGTPDEAFAPTLTHRDVLEFATIDGA